MGALAGHVAPGILYFVIGLWHLLNHIKFHALHPNSYTSLPWFPTSKIKYLELYFIMTACSMYIAMELFISPNRHQPLDPDGTIPSYRLHNVEHGSISMTFFLNSALAIGLDKIDGIKAKIGITQLLVAIDFGQELFLFHLHSTDHTGVEGQYHLLLQMLVLVSLITSLMSIGHPKSFIVSFVRSISIIFQGVWIMVMGFMLWTPEFMPKGCFMNLEENLVRCHSHQDLERAKSLVKLEFSWYLIGIIFFSMSIYLVMIKIFGERVEYLRVEEEIEAVEAQKKNQFLSPKVIWPAVGF